LKFWIILSQFEKKTLFFQTTLEWLRHISGNVSKYEQAMILLQEMAGFACLKYGIACDLGIQGHMTMYI
jgi:hypothetical protein